MTNPWMLPQPVRSEPTDNVKPHPSKGHQITDRPKHDAGGNFGRLTRYGIMEEYVQHTMNTALRGIPAREWLKFFKRHARAS